MSGGLRKANGGTAEWLANFRSSSFCAARRKSVGLHAATPYTAVMKSFAIVCAALLVALPAATAQTPLLCDHQNQNSYCEIREITLPFSGSVDANTGGVGAITVQGWDNAWVFVRAHVTTSAEDEFQARLLSPSVEIDTSSNRIWASGPYGHSWAVSFEVFLPRASGLELNTRVGAIAISDVTGTIHFNVAVGAATLSGLAGEVAGKTGVGAIAIALAGDRWEGKGIDIETGTGAIRSEEHTSELQSRH